MCDPANLAKLTSTFGNSWCGSHGTVNRRFNNCYAPNLRRDSSYLKPCCLTRKPVTYRPFVPWYERHEPEYLMDKLVGLENQRRHFRVMNVWKTNVYGQCRGCCCSQCPVDYCCED